MVCSNELMRTFFNDSYTSCDSHCTFFFQRTIHIVSFSDGAECTNRMNPNCVAFCGRDFWQRKNISSAPPSHTMNCDIILDDSVKSRSAVSTHLLSFPLHSFHRCSNFTLVSYLFLQILQKVLSGRLLIVLPFVVEISGKERTFLLRRHPTPWIVT